MIDDKQRQAGFALPSSSAPPCRILRQRDQFSVPIRKAFAGGAPERFDEVQVVVREQRRAMPHVSRQQWQLVPNIKASPVPPQQGVYGEAVPEIMNPRQLPFRSADAAFLEQRLKCPLQTRGAISSSAPSGVPDERRIRRKRELPPKPDVKVLLQFPDDGVIDRQQARFVELGLPCLPSCFRRAARATVEESHARYGRAAGESRGFSTRRNRRRRRTPSCLTLFARLPCRIRAAAGRCR